MASKSAAGLTQLFEQISGSEAYKQRYEELQKATGKADEKVRVRAALPEATNAGRRGMMMHQDMGVRAVR